MSCLGKELYVGNIALSIYVETLSPALEQESHFLRESDAEYISSHLFNLAQAESIVDMLNDYLEHPVTAISLLKFLNDEAHCFESMTLEAKEKKQRYVIIIVNALAATLWAHKELQERFIEKCRIMIRIDKATWDSQTSRIRNASAGGRTVSLKALQLRDELYEQLGIPSEFRL
ncbi:MAG: hypothetical protein ACI3ZI_03290 [Candidatus Cryptobacteroides sp.]